MSSSRRVRGSEWRWPQESPEAGNRDARRLKTRSASVVDNEALYRAMLASPDDDGPRYAYADWLATHHQFGAQVAGVA